MQGAEDGLSEQPARQFSGFGQFQLFSYFILCTPKSFPQLTHRLEP
jgi:hypothetical protein